MPTGGHPVIVAIDGNVFVGKSSLLAHAGSRGAAVVPEYEPVPAEAGAPVGSDGPEAGALVRQPGTGVPAGQLVANAAFGQLAVQEGYLVQEETRLRLVRTAPPDARIVTLDRSFLSLLAHTYARFELGLGDVRQEFAVRLVHRIGQGQVVVPGLFVHLEAPWPVIRRRWVLGEASRHGKGTPAELAGRPYCAAVDRFHTAWREALGAQSCLRIDAAGDPKRRVSAGPAETWNRIAAFARRAEPAGPGAVVEAAQAIMGLLEGGWGRAGRH